MLRASPGTYLKEVLILTMLQENLANALDRVFSSRN